METMPLASGASNPRSILGTTPPEFLTQHTVREVLGLEPRRYLRLCRSGAWPSSKIARDVTSRYADVRAFIESRIALRDTKPSNDHDPEEIALGRVGARRVSR